MDKLDLIKEMLDPDELVDVLGVSTEKLVTLLEEYILDNIDRFDYLFNDPDPLDYE